MVARLCCAVALGLLLGLPRPGRAQTPVLAWQQAYGTAREETGGYSVPVPGGYLLLGRQRASTGSVAWLYFTRTNALGDTLWTRKLFAPSSLDPEITGFVRDPAGNLLVTGLEYTSNLGFVLKLDANCVPLWYRVRQLMAPGATFSSTSFWSPLVATDGNYVLIQSLYGQANQTPFHEDTILKLDQASGSELWATSLLPFYQNNFNTAGILYAFYATSTGYIAAILGSVPPGYTSVVGQLQIGPTGVIGPVRLRRNNSNTIRYATYRDPAGNTLLAGRETLTKLDPQGDTLWHTVVPSRYAGRQWDGAAVTQDPQGNYVVVGNSRLVISGSLTAENVHMTRFRPTGQVVNDTMLYRPGQTYGRSVSLAANGELVVSGYTLNGTIGGADLFMYSFRGFRPLAARPAAAVVGSLRLYPNPAGAGADVRVALPTGTARGQLTLHDGLGRQVWRQVAGAGEAVVPAAGLPPGLYVLRLTTADGRVWAGKLVRE